MSDTKQSCFSHRLAIVTGASSGIGQAIARDLASHGAKLVINARRAEKLAALEVELNHENSQVVSVAGDAALEAVVDQLFRTAYENFEADPDVVVVNAGRGLMGSLTSAKLEEFAEVVQTNLVGAVYLMRKAAKIMQAASDTETPLSRARDIVILGSIAGKHLSPFSSLYGSTKFAVASLAEALRRELAPKGIRVTLLEPAIVLSEFQSVAGYDEAWRKTYAEKYGPLLMPDDVARMVHFVISQPAHVHLSNIVVRPTRQEYP